MNNGSKGYERYKKVDVNTAPQGKLVVMLYEGAIKFLENALSAIDGKKSDPKRFENIHNNLVRAQDIITELLVSLNYDAGDIAKRLAGIYTYMNKKLVEANVSKEREGVVEVLTYLKDLKGAWQQASENVSTTPAPQNTGSVKSGKLNVAG